MLNATMRSPVSTEKLPRSFREFADSRSGESEEGQILATWHLACYSTILIGKDEALASWPDAACQTEPNALPALSPGSWVPESRCGSSPSIDGPDGTSSRRKQGARPPYPRLVGCYFVSDQHREPLELLQGDPGSLYRARRTDASWNGSVLCAAWPVNGTPERLLRGSGKP